MYLCKLFVLSISNPSNNNLSVYCKNTSDATNPTIGHGSPEPRIAMFTHLIYATFERLLNPKYLATRSAHTIFYYIHMCIYNSSDWGICISTNPHTATDAQTHMAKGWHVGRFSPHWQKSRQSSEEKWKHFIFEIEIISDWSVLFIKFFKPNYL